MTINPSPSSQPQTIDEWVELLRVEEMPIFSSTAQNIALSLDDQNKGALDLASIILQDPNLTAKVLKVGNSSVYNPSRHRISTVSRAILMLGVRAIRELTLACSFFETVLASTNRDQANREVAEAIHSAVQARELAVALHDPLPEEVFIASLLHNIGPISFWCASGPRVEAVQQQINSMGATPPGALKSLLGFSLQDLGKRLCKAWHLSGLVADAILHPESKDSRIHNVAMGQRICQALKSGWQSEAMRDCLRQLQKLNDEPNEVIERRIKLATAKAAEIARQFGAHQASQLIEPEQTAFTDDKDREITETIIDLKQLQSRILQEISTHILGNIDLNVLFEMVLEGIHRCQEMERTLFFLLDGKQHQLTEKMALGHRGPTSERKFHIDQGSNLFFHILEQGEGCWVKPNQYADLYTPQIANQLGIHESLIFPIEVQNKAIGLIYCDRTASSRAFTLDEFSAANHFVKQAQIGLTLYRIKQH